MFSRRKADHLRAFASREFVPPGTPLFIATGGRSESPAVLLPLRVPCPELSSEKGGQKSTQGRRRPLELGYLIFVAIIRLPLKRGPPSQAGWIECQTRQGKHANAGRAKSQRGNALTPMGGSLPEGPCLLREPRIAGQVQDWLASSRLLPRRCRNPSGGGADTAQEASAPSELYAVTLGE